MVTSANQNQRDMVNNQDGMDLGQEKESLFDAIGPLDDHMEQGMMDGDDGNNAFGDIMNDNGKEGAHDFIDQ